MRNLFILFVLFMWGCDPCADCGTVNFEPTLSMVFIHQSRIDEIEPIVESLDENISNYDSAIATHETQLTELNAILDDLEERMEAGEPGLEDSIEIVENRIEVIEEIDAIALENRTYEDSLRTAFNDTIATIQTGAIIVGEIYNSSSELQVPVTEDSATSFSIPLTYATENLTYEVSIDDFQGKISYFISLDTTLDIRRNILIGADSIYVTSFEGFTQYDTCQRNCTDGQAVFTVYF